MNRPNRDEDDIPVAAATVSSLSVVHLAPNKAPESAVTPLCTTPSLPPLPEDTDSPIGTHGAFSLATEFFRILPPNSTAEQGEPGPDASFPLQPLADRTVKPIPTLPPLQEAAHSSSDSTYDPLDAPQSASNPPHQEDHTVEEEWAGPNIPVPEEREMTIPENLRWGSRKLAEFSNEVIQAYEEVVHFRRNLFNIPTGEAGKTFIKKLTYFLRRITENQRHYDFFAMKAFMVLPALLLQKPSKGSKAKEHTFCLRKMTLWLDGDVQALMKEAKTIQGKLERSIELGKAQAPLDKRFANLVMKGNIRAALKLLDQNAQCGVHTMSEEVLQDLREKHPIGIPAPLEVLLRGPIVEIHPSYYNNIDEKQVYRAALHTKRSSGPSGMDAEVLRRI